MLVMVSLDCKHLQRQLLHPLRLPVCAFYPFHSIFLSKPRLTSVPILHPSQASNSFHLSIKSIFCLHNESINIHTHLLGFLLSLLLLISHLSYTFLPTYPTSSSGDLLAFACFFSGAAVCLGASATYHTISNHSKEVAMFGNRLDYIGIVAMIAGSYMASLYYGFYCLPELYKRYCTMVSFPLFPPYRYAIH